MIPGKLITACLLLIITFNSCKKKDTPVSLSEASYKLTVSGKWKMPEFVVPVGVHFTPLISMVHNSSASMFKLGTLASVGVERVAEDGNAFPLLEEIDNMVSQKKAISSNIIFTLPYNDVAVTSIYANSNYPLLSCMSMIAPSPDWFIGIDGLNLFRNNQWISDTTINLYVHDSGTEDGDIFGQSNPDTSPHQPITLLTLSKATVLANGNVTFGPMATIRFVKQ